MRDTLITAKVLPKISYIPCLYQSAFLKMTSPTVQQEGIAAQPSWLQCCTSVVYQGADAINIFKLPTKPEIYLPLNCTEVFATYVCIAAILGATIGFAAYGGSPSQVPTYQFALSQKYAIPHWRLCSPNIFYYDQLYSDASVRVETPNHYTSTNTFPNLKLSYNYDFGNYYGGNSRTKDCQCNAILRRRGYDTHNSISARNSTFYGNSITFPSSNAVLCGSIGELQNDQSYEGMGVTLLTDPHQQTDLIIYLGHGKIFLKANESKIVKVNVVVTRQIGDTKALFRRVDIVSEQSVGSDYGCAVVADLANSNNNNNPYSPVPINSDTYDITFKQNNNLISHNNRFMRMNTIPCLRIQTQNMFVMIDDGMNSYLLFTACISFIGGALSILIACCGGVFHTRRRQFAKQLGDETTKQDHNAAPYPVLEQLEAPPNSEDPNSIRQVYPHQVIVQPQYPHYEMVTTKDDQIQHGNDGEQRRNSYHHSEINEPPALLLNAPSYDSINLILSI